VKPAPFEYYCPRTLAEALALLAQHGSDAKPLAGGQSLIPAMNFRLATPAVLVDLNAIEGLAFVAHSDADAMLRIGAMTRHCELERDGVIAAQVPLITATMPHVAHAAIRTRGTIGGSLAHADPAAELPAVMLALNASFTLTSAHGSRSVSAETFFEGLFTTALAEGELLTNVTIPVVSGRRFAFREISRRHGDFALAGVAVAITLDDDGRCAEARVALLSVGERPMLASSTARVLLGQQPSVELLRAAADAANHDIDPPSDIHASSRYRRQLVTVLTRRALQEALGALPQ
jgi:aerobic carbon-monoxide dehydrogenase medium subunit